jgi:hypothetical protein
MIATPDFKIFLVQFNVEIDNNIKYLLKRYQERLSKYSKMDEDKKMKILNSDVRPRFSYLKISKVAEYLNHKEVENFRRIRKPSTMALVWLQSTISMSSAHHRHNIGTLSPSHTSRFT